MRLGRQRADLRQTEWVVYAKRPFAGPAQGDRAVACFRDILIHDGSSFAIKAALGTTFPGRFTDKEPAAVVIHATYSGFADEVCAVHIAPDKEAERPFLPDPAILTGCLLLADRGYPSVAFFEAVAAHAGSFIVRLTRSYDPSIRTAWVEGRRTPVPPHPPDASPRR